MLNLSSSILFNNKIKFDFVNEVEVSSSWINLTDTAKIIVPRKLSFKGKPIVIGANSIFERGQPVNIQLGYDNKLITRFNGFISKIDPRLPISIECEDAMYSLKKNQLATKTFNPVTLKNLLAYIIPAGVKYEATMDQGLGKFQIANNATTAMVLDYLRQKFSIYSFFRDGVLYVGLAYVVKLRRDHVFHMEKNVISSNLEYLRADDLSVRIRAVSINSTTNKQIEVFYPDKLTPGETNTIYLPDQFESDLLAYAKRYYETFKYEGWRGSFTTFGAPYVNHGDSVELQSNVLPEYNGGKYLVKSVKITFGMGGYRQIIELANRIS